MSRIVPIAPNLLALILTLGQATIAAGQTAARPEPPPAPVPGLEGKQTDPHVIARKLRLSLRHHETAINALNAGPSQEAIDQTAKLVLHAYRLVRSAHVGTQLRISKQKGRLDKGQADPILVQTERSLRDARDRLPPAIFKVKHAKPNQLARIQQGVDLLRHSSRKIEEALALMGQPSAN